VKPYSSQAVAGNIRAWNHAFPGRARLVFAGHNDHVDAASCAFSNLDTPPKTAMTLARHHKKVGAQAGDQSAYHDGVPTGGRWVVSLGDWRRGNSSGLRYPC
jgi:hypothetical protein